MQVYPHKRSSNQVIDSQLQINQKIVNIQEKLIIANKKSKLAECKLHEAERRAEKAEKDLCFFQDEAKDIKQKICQLYEDNKSQKLKLEKRVLTADMKVSKMENEVKSELAKQSDRGEKKLINTSNQAAMVEVIQIRARKAEQELYNANRKAEKDLTDAGKKIAMLEEELKEFQTRTKIAEEELGIANTKALSTKQASQAEETLVQTTPSPPCEVKLVDKIYTGDNTHICEKLRKAATTIQSIKDMAVQVEMLPLNFEDDRQMVLKKTRVPANRRSGDALAKLQTAERLMKKKHPSTHHHSAASLDCEIINGEVCCMHDLCTMYTVACSMYTL